MYCINGDGRPVENKDTGLCSTCARELRKAEAKHIEVKEPKKWKDFRHAHSQRTWDKIYLRERKKWIKGKKCQARFPHNCPIKYNLTVHHQMGRIGFADEWARENEQPLLIDKRYWIPLCLEAHRYIEEHPKWACENGYSFLRVTDPVFRKQK